MPSNVPPLPTAGAEIELAPRSESRRHPPTPTSSVEVKPTASVEIEHATRHGSRCSLAWSRIDMVSTMYHPEAKLDSSLVAPFRSLREIGRRRSLMRYDLEPSRTYFLSSTRLGDDISSTMRFCTQSSHTIAKGSTIIPGDMRMMIIPSTSSQQTKILHLQ
ncbi:hypothetical protein GOBAR_DD21530 [Gossypium barbadense]|nr:hypothetical protein GOBAR_DD21530 [Gossypium barbadense]